MRDFDSRPPRPTATIHTLPPRRKGPEEPSPTFDTWAPLLAFPAVILPVVAAAVFILWRLGAFR